MSLLLYQNQCPKCFLHARPERAREFWTADDTAETNNPAVERTRGHRGRTGEEVITDNNEAGAMSSDVYSIVSSISKISNVILLSSVSRGFMHNTINFCLYWLTETYM